MNDPSVKINKHLMCSTSSLIGSRYAVNYPYNSIQNDVGTRCKSATIDRFKICSLTNKTGIGRHLIWL